LIAERYVWCKYDSSKAPQELPICRAKHGEKALLTGTLYDNGKCRLVNSLKLIKTDDIEVLVIGKSSCE
jgi:hypothetical protein